MDRRTMLKAGGLGLLGWGLGACSGNGGKVRLPPVFASWDRVIRTSVGLRPHRPAGVRLEAERFGATTVIHNYGHGGAGVSLSWGTGHLAADKVVETGARSVSVIGSGAVGLATARQLQRRGVRVTIHTRALWPDGSVCSGHAPARFTPGSFLIDPDLRTPEFDALYERAAALAYRYWHDLAGTGYGVHWRYSYSLRDEPRSRRPSDAEGPRELDPLGVGEVVELEPGSHPFGDRYAVRRVGLAFDMPVYLDAMLRDFLLWGGRLEIRDFEDAEQILRLSDRVVVNCTGAGAARLWGDRGIEPLKGQLTLLVPQPEVDFVLGGGGFSMVPRSDFLLLGGPGNSPNDWSMEPDEEAERQVVESAIEVFGTMRGETRVAAGPVAQAEIPGPDSVRFQASDLAMETAA
jgi:glycine/D-amino acid oxidase-like deaminating enzyme